MKIEISKKHIWFIAIAVGLLVIASLAISYAPIVYNVLPAQILPQGAGSTLDSDKVDALHASDLLSAAGGGGIACTSNTASLYDTCCMISADQSKLLCRRWLWNDEVNDTYYVPVTTKYVLAGNECGGTQAGPCNADSATAGKVCVDKGKKFAYRITKSIAGAGGYCYAWIGTGWGIGTSTCASVLVMVECI